VGRIDRRLEAGPLAETRFRYTLSYDLACNGRSGNWGGEGWGQPTTLDSPDSLDSLDSPDSPGSRMTIPFRSHISLLKGQDRSAMLFVPWIASRARITLRPARCQVGSLTTTSVNQSILAMQGRRSNLPLSDPRATTMPPLESIRLSARSAQALSQSDAQATS
jgi:hypothetical protein